MKSRLSSLFIDTCVNDYIIPHDAFKDVMLDMVISDTLKGGAGKMFGLVVICSLT